MVTARSFPGHEGAAQRNTICKDCGKDIKVGADGWAYCRRCRTETNANQMGWYEQRPK